MRGNGHLEIEWLGKFTLDWFLFWELDSRETVMFKIQSCHEAVAVQPVAVEEEETLLSTNWFTADLLPHFNLNLWMEKHRQQHLCAFCADCSISLFLSEKTRHTQLY